MQRACAIIVVCFVACAGCASGPRRGPVPAAAVTGRQIDAFTWDFGIIPKDTVVGHMFRLDNGTARTLTIKNVTTSCGCTASKAKNNRLAPGESTAIEVTFNSKGYKQETTQFVYVTTDDPENPLIKFTIKAFVE
ncbi:MAG: DUF1573 domain-containing protein [Candidatus Omnitrophica bacterium]|nr:DUF1573 domain-containing protein [Candidatus Omnitrophota bacterium]